MSSEHSDPDPDPDANLKQGERRSRRERRIHKKRARKRVILAVAVILATLCFLMWAFFFRDRGVRPQKDEMLNQSPTVHLQSPLPVPSAPLGRHHPFLAPS